jgi:hypothetical protein
MGKVEGICQTILADRDQMIIIFKTIFSSNDPAQLVKILDIKGVKKADQVRYALSFPNQSLLVVTFV